MTGSKHVYHHGNQELHGYLALGASADKPRPAVLVAHDWSGCSTFAWKKAEFLASLGYIGFALDMYGEGKRGDTTEERMALVQPFFADRQLMRDRIRAAFDTVSTMPGVDKNRIAAIGFCFGGMCVLDLARSGAVVKGVVSFHGLLNGAKELPNAEIHASMLVLHGYDDPMVKPDDVNAFCQEMTAAKVDWQVHQYGHTQHSFTNPDAHNQAMGTVYDARSERRSLQSMVNFLHELFDQN